MARRSAKLLRFENTLYKYDNITQSWKVDNLKLIADNNDLFDTGTHATCKHMSQKVTPTKLRRGFLDHWSMATFLDYKDSKVSKINLFYFEFLTKQYLESVLQNLKVFFEVIEICKVKDVFHFNVSYYEPKFTSKRDLQIEPFRLSMFKNAGLLLDNKDSNLNPFFIELPQKANSRGTTFKLNTEKLASYLEHQIFLFLGQKVKISFKVQSNISNTATLFANVLAYEVEKSNANFKRALRESFKEIKLKSKIKGIRINCSGRLGKAPMAKTEWFKFGQIPLNTIKASVQYADSTAFTKYGTLGIKVWIYHHEK
tara:strand:- start:4657 stop:5595 length:939 start_codon:yes stop_codon:yes gene_type:complete